MKLAFLTAVGLAAATGAGACPDAAAVDAFVAARRAGQMVTEVPLPEGGTMEDAICAQKMIVDRMVAEDGPVIGYKAGLTSGPAQAAFGVEEPVLGTLVESVMLKDGAVVKVSDAARPLYEADLVVEIADEGVNDAQTPEEVLEHIAGVRPFLELPDLVVAPDVKMAAPELTAVNVGAWRGVLGDLIEVPNGAEGVAMLANLTARVHDGDGVLLSEAPGSVVLGNPLNSVIWVADMLHRDGRSLKAGDLVSVGSIGPLHPMKAGSSASVIYDGLPGTPTLSAKFE